MGSSGIPQHDNMSSVPTVTLSSGHKIPMVGLGTFLSKPGEVLNAVEVALRSGYRHVDGAHVYGNESEVGKAIANSGIKREELFLTSKLWNTFHRPEEVIPALKKTLADLGVDYIDLYLIHWPIAFVKSDTLFPADADGKNIMDNDAHFKDTWKAMEKCVEEGLARSIGVSNFNVDQIKQILEVATIPPAMNQVENHPYLQQNELVEFCKSKNIAITAYAPLGAPARPWTESDDPVLMEESIVKQIAEKYNKTPANVLVRFQLQRDIIVIPKSVTESRIISNFDVLDFELSEEDMNALRGLERGFRGFAVTKWENSSFYPF